MGPHETSALTLKSDSDVPEYRDQDRASLRVSKRMPTDLHDIATLSGHRDRITSVAFAPGRNDVVLSSGRDGAIAVWTVFGEESAEAALYRHNAAVRYACFWPDQQGVLFAAEDGSARLVDLESSEETGRFTTVQALLESAQSPTGLVKTVGNTVKVARELVAVVVPLGGLITAATKAGETASPIRHAVVDATLGRVATLAADHTVTLYDLLTGEVIRKWSVPADDRSRLAFAAGSLIVAGANKLLLLDETLDKPGASQRPTRSAIRGMIQLDANRIATYDASKTFTVWDAERRATVGSFKAPAQPAHACLCGKDRVLIADSGRRVAVLPIAGHAETSMYEADAGKVRAIAASDDGSRIAIAGDELKLRILGAPSD